MSDDKQGTLIDLDAHRPHEVGFATCSKCGARQVSVGPLNMVRPFECGKCGEMAADFDGARLTSDRDWPAFWATLTDAEAAACLRAAPRVAGEWIDRTNAWGDTFHERIAAGGERVAYLFPKTCGAWAYGTGHLGTFSSLSLARAACDSALRASGWRVIG